MFDGGTIVASGVVEQDWKLLHLKLRGIAEERVKLEAKEVSYLVEAEEAQLHLRLGYATFREYMERELHWEPHTASERIRVAHELLELPAMQEEFAAGRRCFSVVRELTRVATADTEEAWLEKSAGKTAKQVQHMVKGREKGDRPEDPIDPSKIKERLVFEVSGALAAMIRKYRADLEREEDQSLGDDEFLMALLHGGTSVEDGLARPAVQVAVTTCRDCKRGWQIGAGEAVELTSGELAHMTCDAIDVGDLETDDLTRPTQDIPEALRRKTAIRDKFSCTVPGCRSKRFLQVHHVVHRADGGTHTMTDLLLLCFGHHRQHHLGQLEITGKAPDVVFRWTHEVKSAVRPAWGEDKATDTDERSVGERRR